MSQILYTLSTLRVPCPHCGKVTENDDIEVACMVIGVDPTIMDGEGRNPCECEHCGKDFHVFAECSIDVTKEAA